MFIVHFISSLMPPPDLTGDTCMQPRVETPALEAYATPSWEPEVVGAGEGGVGGN